MISAPYYEVVPYQYVILEIIRYFHAQTKNWIQINYFIKQSVLF